MEEAIVVDRLPEKAESGSLLRILGVGFGLAVALGGTVGVGILRNPGGVAEQLGSYWPIMLAWLLGGFYCLLNANHVAELATMTPKAGGFYAYAERAFGRYGGFVVGWSDWLNNTLALAFISVVFGEYASGLFAPTLSGGRVIFSLLVLLSMTALNWLGLRAGSETQKITSILKAAALLVFVAACFVFGGSSGGTGAIKAANPVTQTGLFASVTAFVLAFQMVLSTYDGWYSPIYFSEENVDPSHSLPKSLFGGIALVTIIYLLVNFALLYVLPMEQLAGSKFAGGDAMSLMFGERSGQVLTIMALLSLIGIINAVLMMCPRTLFGLGRDGLFTVHATKVNRGGTPVVALFATALIACILTSIGTFEVLLAIGAFFIAVIMMLVVIALFVLRRREPDTPRPFRTWGYPFLPVLMLMSAAGLCVAYVVSNPWPSLYAIIALALSYPVFKMLRS
jgi:basic amino acid/polyamine antiporter, APA family